MRKYLLSIFIIMAGVLVFGFLNQKMAKAGEINVPDHVLKHHQEQGTKIANYVWFPFVPSNLGAQFPWETYIFLSNWTGGNITVSAWATGFGEDPTIKSITLAPYEKRILQLGDWGLRNTMADVYFTSNNYMGAAAIILNTQSGEFITALPPINARD